MNHAADLAKVGIKVNHHQTKDWKRTWMTATTASSDVDAGRNRQRRPDNYLGWHFYHPSASEDGGRYANDKLAELILPGAHELICQ